MTEPRKRGWSIRPAVHRRRFVARRTSLPKATASGGPSPRTPWLSDGEELVTAVLNLTSRSFGSLVLGMKALFGPEPGHRLATLKREGRILPWTSLLVVSAAMFGALLPMLNDYELSDLVGGVALVPSFSTYFERLLPTIVIGLLICKAADVFCTRKWKSSSAAGVRLVASTIFASSLMSTLWAFGWAHALAKWNEPGPIPPPIEVLEVFTWRSLVVPALFCATVFSWFLLLCCGCALAAVRSNSKSERPGLSWLLRLLRLSGLAVWMLAGFSLPPAIVLASLAAVQLWAPSVAEIASIASEPEELAQVIPLQPICGWRDLDKISAYECLLVVRTAGKGQIILQNVPPVLLLSMDRLGEQNSQQFPFRLSHGLIQQASEMRGGVITLETFFLPEGLDISTEGGKTLADMRVIDLGQPVSFRLRFSMPNLCGNAKFAEIRRYTYFYVRVLAARETIPTGSREFSAIGPWSLPADMFNRCH